MNDKRPLSVSSYNLYVECPQKYKLDKIDRLRPIVQPSYFIFGSAVDKGLNSLLLEDGSPLEACESELKRLVVENVEFLQADYDGELLEDATREALLAKAREFGYTGDNIDSLVSALFAKGHVNLSENQRKVLALCCTASLKEKAKLMLDAYKRQVLPSLRHIESVQREIKWKDERGNEFVLVLDLEADDAIYDNKTASRPYEPDAVVVSMQLAIYTKVTGKERAGFFVMGKNVLKNRIKTCTVCGKVAAGRHKTCAEETDGQRCGGEFSETIKPEISIQFLSDVVPKAEQEIAQDALTGVAEAIKAKQFPKNLKSCRVKYGPKEVRCPYYDYCRSGSSAGLVKVPPSGK